MIVLDANLLLYAFDATSPRHATARSWLEGALSGNEEIGFPLATLMAFVRIGTDPRVFDAPLDPVEAVGIVESWLDRPNTRIVHPTPRHWPMLVSKIDEGRVRGPGVMDAHLAALTQEHGGVLCTTDRGFARYTSLRTIDPTG